MATPSYFNDDKIPEEDRRNIAFQVVNATREAVSIAVKNPQPLTYRRTMDMVFDLNVDIYKDMTALLMSKNESDKVMLFKELAESKSTPEKIITPLELIEIAIAEYEELRLKGTGKKKQITKELMLLNAAREFFTPDVLSEHRILNRDYQLPTRDKYFGVPIYEKDNFKDYKLPNGNALRLRLLHPDKYEAVLGADLIYEQFDLKKQEVRFIHLQYKTWDNKTLYLNDPRMKAQITKMDNHLCKSGYCNSTGGNNKPENYRMPYCSAFLRPTSKIQNSNSKLITTGIHIPLCEVIKVNSKENKITDQNIQEKCLNHNVFETLFNNNQIGSRWIPISELDRFYESKGLKSLTANIVVHAQEVFVESEEEKASRKEKEITS